MKNIFLALLLAFMSVQAIAQKKASETGYGTQNFVIGGGFDFWQRGTSQSISSIASADRWWVAYTGSSATLARQNFGMADIPNQGVQKHFARMTSSSVAGAGNFVILQHRIESVRTLAGQQATLSFWAKSDANRSIAAVLQQSFGEGGSPSSPVFAGLTKVDLTTAWKRYSITVAVPSVSGKTIGTNADPKDGLYINFWLDCGSTYAASCASIGQQSGVFDFAQIMLNTGDRAAPFALAGGTIGGELALAQRYYEKSYPIGTAVGTAETRGASRFMCISSGAGLHSWVPFKTTKRVSTPVISFYSPVTGAGGFIRNLTGTADVALYSPTVDAGRGDFGFTFETSSACTAAYLYLMHFSADAEL